MSKRLSPYGVENFAGSFATVGKSKASNRITERLPSRDLLAKVGILAAVGVAKEASAERTHRVLRLKANVA